MIELTTLQFIELCISLFVMGFVTALMYVIIDVNMHNRKSE